MRKIVLILGLLALGGQYASSKPLDLQTAIMLVASNHPVLSIAEADILAARAEALQAGLLLNPVFNVEIENVAGSGEFSGADVAEYTFFLSQTIELGGKRRKRKEAALRLAEVAEWSLAGRRRALEQITIRTFYSTLAAESRVSLSVKLVEMAKSVLAKAEQRVDAGRAHKLEVTKATIELSDAELSLQNSLQVFTASKDVLASLWGGVGRDISLLAGNLEDITIPRPIEELTISITNHPDILQADAQIKQSMAMADLENAQRIPSIDVGGGVRFIEETGDQAFVVGLSIPLAFGDRNQGNREAARIHIAQSKDNFNVVRLELYQELVEKTREVNISYTQVVSIKEKQLPAARLAFNQANDGYSKGLFGSLDLLDSMRGLFEQEVRYINALQRYHQSKAELDSLIAPGSKNETRRVIIEGKE